MKISIMHIKKLANIFCMPILLLAVANCGGGGGGGSTTTVITTPTVTGTVTWDSPTTNMDGSCLLTDLAGYKLYYGTTTRVGTGAAPSVNDSAFSYDSSVTVPLTDSNLDCKDTAVTPEPGCGVNKLCGYTATLSGLATGSTYYAAVTAYDASGYESDYSVEVSNTVD